MSSRKKMQVGRPEFIVETKPSTVAYNPVLDRNLEYFFSSKNNCRILRKTRVINARNQILDRNVTKAVQSGLASLNTTFKIRNRKNKQPRNKTVETSHIQNRPKQAIQQVAGVSQRPQTVDKDQFLSYLQEQRAKLQERIKLKVKQTEDAS